MGQREDGGRGVIDADFAGLAAPRRTVAMGRPDISQDRPGETLVARVREFAEGGGFRALAGASAERQALGDAPDPSRGGPPAPGPSLPGAGGEAPRHDRS